MKKKELLLIAALILFGFIFQYFDSGEIAFSKGCNIDKKSIRDVKHPHNFFEELTFETSTGGLKIFNPAGSIEVSPSSDEKIKIEAVKVVYHKDSLKVEKYRKMVKIKKDRKGDTAIINVISNNSNFPYRRIRIFFKIYIPINVKLDVKNRFGNINIDSAGTGINVDGKFGDVDIENISSDISVINRFGETNLGNIKGKIELDVKFSRVRIANSGSLDCRIGHSSLELSDVRENSSVKIEGAHTKLSLKNVRSEQIKIKNSHNRINISDVKTDELIITSRHCKVVAENLSSKIFSIKNSHNKIRLKNIKGSILTILLSHGDLEISLSEMFENIFITNSYSDITLNIPSGTDPSLSMNSKYGEIVNNTGLEVDSIKEKFKTTFTRKGSISNININTSYGDIRFSENTP